MAEEVLTPPSESAVSLPKNISYEQFLQWDGPAEHVEWVDGAVIPMSPVTAEHQLVALFIIRTLSEFTERKQLGKVFHEPFQMKTRPNLPGRAPDVLFLLNAKLGRQKRLHVEGPADVVVEVISPGSPSLDRGEKFYEYEEGGVPEYWLIDPERKQAEFYRLGEDRIYRQTPIEGEGIYRSRIVEGFWVKVDWLWTRPPLTEVTKAWNLPP